MDFLYAILLGTIQGITEFLPVSSSGHLIVFSHFTKGQPMPLTLNVALHMGTLLAILIYFRNEWLSLIRDAFKFVKKPNISSESPNLVLALIIGTVPAGVVGLLFKDQIESYFHNPLSTVPTLIIVGILMFIVDRKMSVFRKFSNITWVHGLLIGVAQVLALGLKEPTFFVAVFVSFIVGWITIAGLLKLLKKYGFGGFAIYRILLALTILVMLS